MTPPLRDSAAPAGERFTATFMDVTGLEHLHRYQLASLHAQDKDVLDIACGAGYGSWMLAQGARRVFGVDASAEVIAHASDRYHRDNLSFHQGFCADIPLETASIDVIVSFETLEHIFEQDEFLNECHRVLRPTGVLIISTPNVDVYNHGRAQLNPFHVKELTAVEFELAISRFFPNVVVGMQGLGFGSLVTFPHAATLYHSELLEQSGAISARAKLAMYCIAIASARPLPELLHGFCVAPLTVAEEFRHMATGIELLRHAHARNLDHDVIVSALRDELQIAQKQLDAIQTSTSWRLTRPLRLLIDVLRR